MHATFIRPAGRALLCVTLILTVCTKSIESQTSRDTFQRALQDGRPASITGSVTALYGDDFAHNRAELIYRIQDERSGQPLRLHLSADDVLNIETGTRVTVDGRIWNSELYVQRLEKHATGNTAGRITQPPHVSPLTATD